MRGDIGIWPPTNQTKQKITKCTKRVFYFDFKDLSAMWRPVDLYNILCDAEREKKKLE